MTESFKIVTATCSKRKFASVKFMHQKVEIFELTCITWKLLFGGLIRIRVEAPETPAFNLPVAINKRHEMKCDVFTFLSGVFVLSHSTKAENRDDGGDEVLGRSCWSQEWPLSMQTEAMCVLFLWVKYWSRMTRVGSKAISTTKDQRCRRSCSFRCRRTSPVRIKSSLFWTNGSVNSAHDLPWNWMFFQESVLPVCLSSICLNQISISQHRTELQALSWSSNFCLLL